VANIALFITGIVLIELLFGDWLTPAGRIKRLRIPQNEQIIFDVSELYPTDNPKITYTRDKYGFRGKYPSPAEIDILTIGGSTTDQRYLGDGQTWQDVLASEFATHGRTVSVVNAGVDGQSTYGHLKNFDWWFPSIPDLRVKWFLFYIGVNDFYRDANFRYDRLIKPGSLRNRLEACSALYDLFRVRRGVQQARIYRVPHVRRRLSECQLTDQPLVKDHRGLMESRLAAYAARLEELVRKAKAAGGGVIVVTQPVRSARPDGTGLVGDAAQVPYDRVEINGVDQFLMMDLLNKATLRKARELGCLAFDAANEIAWEDSDFYDFHHNTPQGARKLGRYLYQQLKDINLQE